MWKHNNSFHPRKPLSDALMDPRNNIITNIENFEGSRVKQDKWNDDGGLGYSLYRLLWLVLVVWCFNGYISLTDKNNRDCGNDLYNRMMKRCLTTISHWSTFNLNIKEIHFLHSSISNQIKIFSSLFNILAIVKMSALVFYLFSQPDFDRLFSLLPANIISLDRKQVSEITITFSYFSTQNMIQTNRNSRKYGFHKIFSIEPYLLHKFGEEPVERVLNEIFNL